ISGPATAHSVVPGACGHGECALRNGNVPIAERTDGHVVERAGYVRSSTTSSAPPSSAAALLLAAHGAEGPGRPFSSIREATGFPPASPTSHRSSPQRWIPTGWIDGSIATIPPPSRSNTTSEPRLVSPTTVPSARTCKLPTMPYSGGGAPPTDAVARMFAPS